jgi:hypothetical protein
VRLLGYLSMTGGRLPGTPKRLTFGPLARILRVSNVWFDN